MTDAGIFDMSSAWWEIVVRTVLVFLALLIGLRVAGKREIGQMTLFDLVVILLIANAVQNSMVGADVSVQGGIVAAVVLIAVDRIVSALRLRRGIWAKLIEGAPSVLVQDGHVVEPHLRREGVSRDELEMVMREHGVGAIDDVRLAVLETDGSISIVPRTSDVVRTRRHFRQLRKE